MKCAKSQLANITMCEEFSGPENSYLNLLSEIKYLDNLFKCLVFVLIECVFSVGITQCVCQRVGSVQTEVCIRRQSTSGWPGRPTIQYKLCISTYCEWTQVLVIRNYDLQFLKVCFWFIAKDSAVMLMYFC